LSPLASQADKPCQNKGFRFSGFPWGVLGRPWPQAKETQGRLGQPPERLHPNNLWEREEWQRSCRGHITVQRRAKGGLWADYGADKCCSILAAALSSMTSPPPPPFDFNKKPQDEGKINAAFFQDVAKHVVAGIIADAILEIPHLLHQVK